MKAMEYLEILLLILTLGGCQQNPRYLGNLEIAISPHGNGIGKKKSMIGGNTQQA